MSVAGAIKFTTALACDTGCSNVGERQKVAECHKYHSLFCYSAEWSWGTSTPHSGTTCSRIISRIKYICISLLYSKTAKGFLLVLFFYLFVFCPFSLLLLTYSLISCWNMTKYLFCFSILFMAKIWPWLFFSILLTSTIIVFSSCLYNYSKMKKKK